MDTVIVGGRLSALADLPRPDNGLILWASQSAATLVLVCDSWVSLLVGTHCPLYRCDILRVVAEENVRKIASLLRERNLIDEKLAALIGRPLTSGHLGEWIAAQILDIELEESAVTAAIDGRSGPSRSRAAPSTSSGT